MKNFNEFINDIFTRILEGLVTQKKKLVVDSDSKLQQHSEIVNL